MLQRRRIAGEFLGLFDDIGNSTIKAFNDTVKGIFSYDASDGQWGTKDSLYGGAAYHIGHGTLNPVVNLIGYNPSNGKWGDKGSDVDWMNEGLGQINGANAQRHALGVAGDAVIAAQAKQNLLIQQEQTKKMQSDIQASNGAQAIRKSGGSVFNPSSTTPLAQGNKLGADTQNFLGV